MRTPRPSVLRVAASLALLGGAAASVPCRADEPAQAKTTFLVVGYLPEYHLRSFDPVQLAPPLTDLIAFSIEPKVDGSLATGRLKADDLKRLREETARRKVRLHVALGGWGRSKGFAPMAADGKARARFVEELVRHVKEHKLDGADFDWEHPANRAEEESYATLLADVKRAFEPERLIVSVTVAAWQNLEPEAFRVVDRVQVMAYDHDGRHSTPEGARKDIETMIQKGAPKGRLLLGVPFYGRDVKDRRRERDYARILRENRPTPEADEAGGFYFNGPRTIQAKARMALDDGLGGVMIWELGQDAPGEASLLRALGEVVPKGG